MFSGVYTDFQQATIAGADPWASDGWRDHCETLAKRITDGRSQATSLKDRAKAIVFGDPDYPVHLHGIIRTLKSELAHGRVRVLDFGGGFGDNHVLIARAVGSTLAEHLDYVVVDVERSVELGRRLFPSVANLTFDAQIPDTDFDHVLICGTLQYIEDWRALLQHIATRTGRSIWIARTPLAVGKTFATSQTVTPQLGASAGQSVGACPLWFIARGDIEAALPRWHARHAMLQRPYHPVEGQRAYYRTLRFIRRPLLRSI